jgi:hypothetical protein
MQYVSITVFIAWLACSGLAQGADTLEFKGIALGSHISELRVSRRWPA